MKARHLFFAAALFSALFAAWAIATTPAPTQPAAAASMLQPF